MNRWKRMVAYTTGAITLATAGIVVVSMTPAGAAALRSAGGAISGALAGARPSVEANGAGSGGSGTGLGPITLSVAPKARLTSKLTADVSVTESCGPFLQEQFSDLNLQLSQAAGHTVAQGFGSLGSQLPCDGGTYTFVITVTAQNVPYHPGSAVANVSADACGVDVFGNSECQSGQVTAPVSLRK